MGRSTSCARSLSTACARSTRVAKRSSPVTTCRSSPTSSPAARPGPRRPTPSSDRVALHCPECGFVNADGANYCQKCGSYLGALEERAGGEPSKATYRLDEQGEVVTGDGGQAGAPQGAAGVIRAGGVRVVEFFALDHDRMTIGRRPDS